jgi:membrane fusion protein, copper/silver efflux system
MKRSEARWLIIGLILGAVFMTGAYFVYENRNKAWEPVSADGDAVNATGPTVDAATASTDVQAIQLTNEEVKTIGVETVEVQLRNIRKEVTAPGKVAEPETGISTISARIGGRIEKLLLNVTGESVARGQAVALLYSPDVFTAGEEYKLALENRQRLSASKEPQAITEADELVRASRRRLELWGLTSAQIDEIAGSQQDRPIQITIFSTVSGVVTKRNIAEGQYVREGDVLYTVADLGSVWVQADIFEADIPLIRVGQAVRITAPSLNRALSGSIAFLQPAIDPQTRTMTARIQVANPQMILRPGLFVQISYDALLGANIVAVPRSAVLDTGKERVVYVAKDNGVFEKRLIEGSIAGDEYYAVAKGVAPGERVVTHGSFLIDSQTRLAANVTGLFGGSKAFANETNSKPPESGYIVNLRPQSSPLKGGAEGMFRVTVTAPDGKPVTDAEVQITLIMPAMPAMGMGEMRSSTRLAWNGKEYAGSGPIAMAGSWNIAVEARRGGQLLGVYRGRLDAK